MKGEEHIKQYLHAPLIKELKQGSHTAFNELYLMYSDMLYGYVLKLTKSPGEAQDIVQDTFLKIWNGRKNISPDTSFKAYLYTIARNQVIDAFRSKIESVSFESYINSDAYQDSVENNIERAIYYDEFLKRLNVAKNKMAKDQRKIFEMSKEVGYSTSEIAQELGLSEKTVRNYLSLALKIVRAEFASAGMLLYLFL